MALDGDAEEHRGNNRKFRSDCERWPVQSMHSFFFIYYLDWGRVEMKHINKSSIYFFLKRAYIGAM